jgi:two-component system NtrC family sensor kinase
LNPRLKIEEIEALKDSEDLDFLLEDIEQLLNESVDGAVRVKDIVSGLRNFARLDEAEVKEADINEGIESTLKVIWNAIKYKAEVVKELGDIPHLLCYPAQLNQVFMNLLTNAAQAMDERGEINIRTYVAHKNIFIEIKDTGKGIRPEHLDKLFDPFFTTKPVGTGTGLGLAISHGIIEKHKGKISVQSEVGKGTTFTISLPIEGGVESE